MSVSNKSLDKNKRFTGVRATDFVPKTRANDTNRPNVRAQGWANLGKINSRRIPPPANLPSLKSETGTHAVVFDPTIPVNHGWNSVDNSTMNNSQNNATQQEIDSLPSHSSAPATPAMTDFEKSRIAPTWSNITAGTSSAEPITSLLALNDFPRLANNQERKSSPPESTSQPMTNPTFRPTNIATWKEGGSRIQPLMSDSPPNLMSTNPRNYSPSQMWAYPAVGSGSTSHPSQQRQTAMAEYKTPTILRHKDIDNLSKITDNTWANASQEINYEEKIAFSDDEDDRQTSKAKPMIDANNKNRRNHNQLSSHTRLIQDDEHLKQLQEHKNSEFINALSVAKQRRDEQERHLKTKSVDEPTFKTTDENHKSSGFPMRPLLPTSEQENFNSSSWQSTREASTTSRTRNDTSNSQCFSMKSWSDQMDSFNYAALQEKTSGNNDNDQAVALNETNKSQSPSNSPLPIETDRKTTKTRKGLQPLMQSKVSPRQFQPSNSPDYYQENFSSNANTNGSWKNRQQPNDVHSLTQQNDSQTSRSMTNYADQSVNNKSNSSNKSSTNSKRNTERTQNNVRSQLNSSSSQTSNNTRNQQTWQGSSSTSNRPVESNESNIQEATSNYKSQQRYSMSNTMHVDTSSIPPLMSVRSDLPPTNTTHYGQAHEFYDENSADKSKYYQSTNERYSHANRGYTALGSYGRYRRGSAHRSGNSTSQQYSNFPSNNPAPTANNARTKKTQRKSNQMKTPLADEVIAPLMSQTPLFDPLIKKKSVEQSESPKNTLNETKCNSNEEKHSNSKNDFQSNKNNGNPPPESLENETSKINQKRRTQQDQQNFHQAQQVTRHRANYNRTMPNYESSGTNTTQVHYGNSRRSGNPSQNFHGQDGSTGSYYEGAQSQHNQQYSYPNTKKLVNKRGQASMIVHRQGKMTTNNGNYRSKNSNYPHHSTSDNDQKEAEEWETASESSTNVRNGHYENSLASPKMQKSSQQNRSASKKTAINHQKSHARQMFKYTNA